MESPSGAVGVCGGAAVRAVGTLAAHRAPGPRKDWQPATRARQGRPHGRFRSLWTYRNTKSEGNGRSAYGNHIYEDSCHIRRYE
jgi:hypothetical protein